MLPSVLTWSVTWTRTELWSVHHQGVATVPLPPLLLYNAPGSTVSITLLITAQPKHSSTLTWKLPAQMCFDKACLVQAANRQPAATIITAAACQRQRTSLQPLPPSCMGCIRQASRSVATHWALWSSQYT